MFARPSLTSAAAAGAWTALGLVPLEMWMNHHKGIPVLWSNLLWLLAAAIFLFIPGYYFVIGKDNGPFDRTWFLDPEQRARYGVITKRMFAWFVAASAFGSVWSMTLSYIVNQP